MRAKFSVQGLLQALKLNLEARVILDLNYPYPALTHCLSVWGQRIT